MGKYNISAFIPIMQNGLVKNDGQELTGRLLLDAIASDLEIDVSRDMVSNLVKQKIDVHKQIKRAAARPEIMEAAVDYFEDHVVGDLNPHLEDDTCTAIMRLLDTDPSVSDKKTEELSLLYHDGKIGEFLAKSFIYAISKPNKLEKKQGEAEDEDHQVALDAPLIHEVNNSCPLCASWLTFSTTKGRVSYVYTIVNIYPPHLTGKKAKLFSDARNPAEKLASHDNKIALCRDCAADYVYETKLTEYIVLFDIKKQLIQNYQMRHELSKMVLEDDINEVIRALAKAPHVEQSEVLSLNVLEIEKKIRPENAMLLCDLKDDVLRYYRFIQGIFSQMDNFELIASEIKSTFYKIEQTYSDQNDIVEQLAIWILSKTGLSDKRSTRRACEIIVAFFVQSCEVFYEISE